MEIESKSRGGGTIEFAINEERSTHFCKRIRVIETSCDNKKRMTGESEERGKGRVVDTRVLSINIISIASTYREKSSSSLKSLLTLFSNSQIGNVTHYA